VPGNGLHMHAFLGTTARARRGQSGGHPPRTGSR
jgi:hypothetical protein